MYTYGLYLLHKFNIGLKRRILFQTSTKSHRIRVCAQHILFQFFEVLQFGSHSASSFLSRINSARATSRHLYFWVLATCSVFRSKRRAISCIEHFSQ